MNIWCVGRNYSEHARELGNALPEEPMIFLKAGSCQTFGPTVHLPSWTQEVHHELEIAFQFDEQLNFKNVTLALDLTERQRQAQSKAKGQPWTLAKSFTGACPMAEGKSLAALGGIAQVLDWEFSLEVNGQIRQKGRLNQMIYDLETLRIFVKSHFPVQPQDWLLTGTPAGVAALKNKDRLVARWGSFPVQNWQIQSL